MHKNYMLKFIPLLCLLFLTACAQNGYREYRTVTYSDYEARESQSLLMVGQAVVRDVRNVVTTNHMENKWVERSQHQCRSCCEHKKCMHDTCNKYGTSHSTKHHCHKNYHHRHHDKVKVVEHKVKRNYFQELTLTLWDGRELLVTVSGEHDYSPGDRVKVHGRGPNYWVEPVPHY